MATNGNSMWSEVPDMILLRIFEYLNRNDRFAASVVCSGWNRVFQSASLWKNFTFKFAREENKNQIKFLEDYGRHLRSVTFQVNPQITANLENLCRAFRTLARSPERRLERLAVSFVQEPQIFFRGQDVLESLAELFGPPDPEVTVLTSLKEVDLGGLDIAYTHLLFELLSSNNRNLQVLNIQNRSLTCKVEPHGLVRVVKQLKQLRSLSCFYLSVSQELVDVFLEDKERVPLERLSLACIRENKFQKPLTIEAWDKLSKKFPRLRVSLFFDHTIERENILGILHPPIPLVELSLYTMAELHSEISLVDRFYSQTLEKLVLLAQGTDELEQALLSLIENAANLNSIQCFCGLRSETIARIKSLKPNMKDYTLKTKEEYHNAMPPVLIGMEARTTAMDISGGFQE